METNERRSSVVQLVPAGSPTPKPAGLPIPSTEPLTAAEREALRRLAIVYRSAAASIDGVLAAVGTTGRPRVDQAMASLGIAFEAGDRAAEVRTMLGRGR